MTGTLRDALTTLAIGGKPAALFEKHHFALLAWHDWARQLPKPPRLLSLDYHTDSHAAFLSYGCTAAGDGWWKDGAAERERLRRLSGLVGTNSASVETAVLDLRYDEHIDAALQSGILDVAFIVSRNDDGYLLSNEQLTFDLEWERGRQSGSGVPGGMVWVEERPTATPPFSYALPANRLVVLDDTDAWTDEASERVWRDSLLESTFLQGRLDLIDAICTSVGIPGLFERPFILDIDLDAFNTRRAIAPEDPALFYDLVRRAIGITIAQEPGCVIECQLEGEDLTAAWLEAELLIHLRAALDG